MNILVGPDAFKDAASAEEISLAFWKGIRRLSPHISVDRCPLADGGEGTARILTQQAGAEWCTASVYGPSGQTVEAGFGWLASTQTAFLDMAEASGIGYLSLADRNPLLTTSYGTGQLVHHVLTMGAKNILLGLGGSATNDGGAGMAAALGYRFFRAGHHCSIPRGKDLAELTQIVPPQHRPWEKVKLTVLADVNNPLLGPQGTSAVYGPQKGASPTMIAALEAGLQRLHELWPASTNQSLPNYPGGGAAGGMGAGSKAFLGANLVSGADHIFQLLNIEQRITNSDLVLTGEGRLDRQSLSGKLVGKIARLAQRHQVPAFAVCGQLALTHEDLRNSGLQAAFAISRKPCALSEAISSTLEDAAHTVHALLATYLAGRNGPK